MTKKEKQGKVKRTEYILFTQKQEPDFSQTQTTRIRVKLELYSQLRPIPTYKSYPKKKGKGFG